MEQDWLRAHTNHTYENGRRYYGYKPEFPFPDDKKAVMAHGLTNTVWSHLLDQRTFVAPIGPIKKNHKLLEFATRSGSWTVRVRNPGCASHAAPDRHGCDLYGS